MSANHYSVPLHNRILRLVLRPIFRGLFHLLSDVHISGKENIPEKGAYLIAINHVSLYEAPFVLSFWPVAAEAAGAMEVWSRPGHRQDLLVRMYHAIPVHRGQFDRKAIEAMVEVLKGGHPLLIAPEGERSHIPGMQRAHPGVAYLQEITGVPVVPVGLVGTTEDFWERAKRWERPRIEMRIGKPILLPPIEEKGELRRIARQRNADLVMEHIAALLPPEYRGVYTPVMEIEHSP